MTKLKWKRCPMPVSRTAPRHYDLVGVERGVAAWIERTDDGRWYFSFRRHDVRLEGLLPTLARCKAFCEDLANGRIAP